MSKTIFNLIDSSFAHDNYAVAGRNSEFVEWDRTLKNKTLPTFYTHEKMLSVNTKTKNAFGLLFESQAIIPHIYQAVESHIANFELVFTHSSLLLSRYSNTRWIPGGGIWVGGTKGLGDVKITDKTKCCSLVSSNKTMCNLHKTRLFICEHLKENGIVDIYKNQNIPIIQSLKDYMFSIVIENFVDDLYFTEKILNCFATGTIPIYFGARKISEKFNSSGILEFRSLDELDRILETLSKDVYYSKMPAIKKNFERCLDYKSMEDYIFKNYCKNWTNT